MRFIGDIHGNMGIYSNIISTCKESIQVGDFGVGFVSIPEFDINHRRIRGNHDDPHLWGKFPNSIIDGHVENDMMFVGGGYSIDQMYRTRGIDWWPEEELSVPELVQMIEKFERVKPRIMVSHDAPHDVTGELFPFKLKIGSNKTAAAFQTMFDAHQPDLWIFGHWHEPACKMINGTQFICLPEFGFIDINI